MKKKDQGRKKETTAAKDGARKDSDEHDEDEAAQDDNLAKITEHI